MTKVMLGTIFAPWRHFIKLFEYSEYIQPLHFITDYLFKKYSLLRL